MRRSRNRVVRNDNGTSCYGGFAAIALTITVSALSYWSIYAQSMTVQREITKMEKEIESLEKELAREQHHWDELTTPARLNELISRSCIAMSNPRAEQIVYMDKSGNPRNGIAVARARQRAKLDSAYAVAQLSKNTGNGGVKGSKSQSRKRQ